MRARYRFGRHRLRQLMVWSRPARANRLEVDVEVYPAMASILVDPTRRDALPLTSHHTLSQIANSVALQHASLDKLEICPLPCIRTLACFRCRVVDSVLVVLLAETHRS